MNHPYLDPAFLVSWSRLTPEAIRPDITEAISRAKENIRTICDQPLESLTYESTFGALEKASEDLHLGWGRIMHLDSVNDEPAQREAIGEMLPEVVAFSSSVPLNAHSYEFLAPATTASRRHRPQYGLRAGHTSIWHGWGTLLPYRRRRLYSPRAYTTSPTPTAPWPSPVSARYGQAAAPATRLSLPLPSPHQSQRARSSYPR